MGHWILIASVPPRNSLKPQKHKHKQPKPKGKPAVVELSQVPKQHVDMVSKRFTLFNTNNVWVSLRALHSRMVEERLSVDVVTHERNVDRVKILQVRPSALRPRPRLC